MPTSDNRNPNSFPNFVVATATNVLEDMRGFVQLFNLGAGGGVAMNYGSSTFNGGSASYTIPHGLSSTPQFVMVGAGSADALGPFYWTVGSSNITVQYGIPTSSGTSNVSFWWFAI